MLGCKELTVFYSRQTPNILETKNVNMDLLRTVNGESVGDWVRFPNHDAALTNIFLIISQSVLLC